MIHLTTDLRQPAELRAAAAFLEALATIRGEAIVARSLLANVIDADDNPERGAPLPPIVPPPPEVKAVGIDPAAVFGTPLKPPPSAIDPAAAFAAALAFAPNPQVLPVPVAAAPSVPLPPPAGVPVPPVSTASGTAPAPSAAPASTAVDKRGIPHSPRIHSTPPTITADGVWRKKRGLNDDALIARVEAELLGAQAAPAAPRAPATR